MHYLSTVKTIADIPQNENATLFMKKNESVTADQFRAAIERVQADDAGHMDISTYLDKDDILIWMGTFFASSDENITLLDPSLPAPKGQFASRVSVVKKRVSAPRKKRAAKLPKEKKNETPDIPIEFGMNKPEEAAEEAADITLPEDRLKADPAVELEDAYPPIESFEKDEEDLPPLPEDTLVTAGEEAAAEKPADEAVLVKERVSVPFGEDTLMFTDKQAVDLYNLLRVRSADVKFSWPTEMLMKQIISETDKAEDNADLESRLRTLDKSEEQVLWAAASKNLEKLKDIVREG